MGRKKSKSKLSKSIFLETDSIEEEEVIPLDYEEEDEDEKIEEINWRYVGGENKIPQLTPELRLRLALLGDAIMCIQKDPTDCNREAQMDHDHSYKWFNGEIESAPTCSFEEVCDLLGLDPSAARVACLKIAASGKFDIRELVFWLR